ncbi:hypothetical protein AOQ84DRAFT_34089 [Glonium stellatum]|uniref:Uncharacterized protein n=1 Tax=Glonium stellatum TaxID=574774 RepID=A0A8E2F1F0_9PEZI|nr:hypothetical protein AOQ84DRAFT_34089 [Glonium stellatum]
MHSATLRKHPCTQTQLQCTQPALENTPLHPNSKPSTRFSDFSSGNLSHHIVIRNVLLPVIKSSLKSSVYCSPTAPQRSLSLHSAITLKAWSSSRCDTWPLSLSSRSEPSPFSQRSVLQVNVDHTRFAVTLNRLTFKLPILLIQGNQSAIIGQFPRCHPP